MSNGRALAVAGLMCAALGMSLPAWAEEPAADAPVAEAAVAEAPAVEAAAVAETPKVDVAAAVAEPAPVEGDTMSAADILFWVNNTWMLVATFMVFIMHLGFSCLEAGLTQSKNTVNILFKNVCIIAIGLLTYALMGFNLMYPGGDPGGAGSRCPGRPVGECRIHLRQEAAA